jgi:phosphatidylserine/phosphatidylglycerophosphate/cardiolipin synthase-like enzyme/V8-like Glu-specific endopeptidase
MVETVSRKPQSDRRALMLETIVREGRPAIPIVNNRISFEGAIVDAAATTIIDRLKTAAPIVEACIPLVGRIDVDNYQGPLTYVGTGWLVAPNVVITNRHVAEIIARSDNGKFKFRPGRFGEELRVKLDYRRELGSSESESVKVARVIWIERDSSGPDIAFLGLDEVTDGTKKNSITLATSDAAANSEVVVIGYPARAPADIVPNQEWMDQIYGGAYDVKRIAPGVVGPDSRGWATHDCTTLGGNSGSVVVDMSTGNAVALHFAGLYMIENYAVPASTITKYLKERPWQGESVPKPGPDPDSKPGTPAAAPVQQAGTATIQTRIDQGQVAVTIPLTITVSLGGPPAEVQVTASTGTATAQPSAPASIDEAARELQRQSRVDGIYSVWPGYKIEDGRLTDVECLVVSAHPERVASVRSAVPATFGKYPVEVRPASIDDIMEATGVIQEAVSKISYNDDERIGEGFSFDWVDEEMSVVLHVGPERSWVVLSDFLEKAQTSFVSSIYEFHAAHIANKIEDELKEGASLTLVLARQSRDPSNNKIEDGDFDRSETFDRWEQNFKKKFDRIFVPTGTNGLVAMSYHIKVTVADGSKIWLSSGNWKKSSQPVIPTDSLNNPKVTSRAGNREWHVLIDNPTLAMRFSNHIKADFERSLELGGDVEAAQPEILIDVPVTVLESMELEGPPSHVLEPKELNRRVRVKPLLTPDKKGAVFSKAVLRLLRSAQRQILFQNQYIKMKGADSGFLKELVDVLIEKSQQIDDFRIILRRENDSLQFDLSQLKRRGMDVEECVRVLPKTHTKGIIVDGKRVLIGSHNWSSLGVTLNRDASLIFDDEEVAQYYAEAFELDWVRASEPRLDEVVTERVQLAEGGSVPSGFKRMTLSDYLEG